MLRWEAPAGRDPAQKLHGLEGAGKIQFVFMFKVVDK